jgi:hypothetical protein
VYLSALHKQGEILETSYRKKEGPLRSTTVHQSGHHFEDLGVNCKMTLKWILNKQVVRVQTGVM